jgi:hypothetical protein
LVLVVDSTERERIPIIREELHKMMAHEDLKSQLFSVTIHISPLVAWAGSRARFHFSHNNAS